MVVNHSSVTVVYRVTVCGSDAESHHEATKIMSSATSSQGVDPFNCLGYKLQSQWTMDQDPQTEHCRFAAPYLLVQCCNSYYRHRCNGDVYDSRKLLSDFECCTPSYKLLPKYVGILHQGCLSRSED